MFAKRSRAVILAIATMFLGMPASPVFAQSWRLATAPLVTKWASDVTPETVRREYPRPQMVRSDWQCLNGLWDFAFDDKDEGIKAGWKTGLPSASRILVPFTYEAALSGIGSGKDVHERVWYRRTFEVPPSWKGRRTLVHFGAVDWQTLVWVNGTEVGRHEGGYTPFSFDITEALKPDGKQEIVVFVYDPADPQKEGHQPKGKQLGSKGIWYTRTTGIWQSVWLEPVPTNYIAGLQLRPDLDKARLDLTVRTRGTGGTLQVKLVREGAVVAEATSRGAYDLLQANLQAPSVVPWTPENPALYDVILTLKNGDQVVDEVKSYTGFRKVSLDGKFICLNGTKRFLRGVLDQGYWPDGILTPPSADALRYDVEMTKAFGFNLARKHVKVEDPLWYYYCDKLGLLVAQDMPSSHNLSTYAAKRNFEKEWLAVMDSVRNHPSIILWIPFNEDWGKPGEYQDYIVELTRSRDRSRPIIDASGWTQRGKTDITDIHDYGNDLKKHANPDPKRTTWIGEYGGVALPVPGHTWVKGWGYQTVKTPEELLAKYKFLTDQINEATGLSGFVYTQLTDVEQELNGVMTYDRIPKAKPADFAAINSHVK